jgi:hypothetical protein
MNKLANARSRWRFREKKTPKFHLASDPQFFSCIFRRSLFLEIAKAFFFEGKPISPPQFSASLQDFMEARRNIPLRHFVYTGAAPYRAAQGEIQKKPHGGSRGVMTRSFSGR